MGFMKPKLILSILLTSCLFLNAEGKNRDELLQEESKAIMERCLKISHLYNLQEGEEIKEITQDLLSDSETRPIIKERILTSDRRFFLFQYPSDGYRVKGYISFVPSPSGNPLLIFLRGGTEMFGLMNPATDFTTTRNYTTLATAYRGGVSEGADQFGGDDVNDVQNLIAYLPALEKKLNLSFAPRRTFILGGSRGAMQMFLALSRFSALQQQVSKAVSLSGMLDIEECMRDRKSMQAMFVAKFGLKLGENEETWINWRNPITTVPSIRKDLPLLIIQGTDDLRVNLPQGYLMLKKLKENGNRVDYMEITGGEHCLGNRPNRMDLIADWLEKEES